MFGWVKPKRPAPAVAEAPALETIPVPRSAYDAAEAWQLPGAVVDFVNRAMNEALFTRAELPAEALQAYHVDYYVAQVNNGGHSQFVHNSGWRDFVIEDIRAGLKACGCIEAEELFEDLCDVAERKPGQFIRGLIAGGFGKYPDVFKRLDAVFFAGLNDRLTRANSDWIRSLDRLEVLDDLAHRDALNALPARNPARPQRLAEVTRKADEAMLQDPIFQACRYVGEASANPVRIVRRTSGSNVPVGFRLFGAVSEDGVEHDVCFFPDRASIGNFRTRTFQPAVPMKQVEKWVRKQTGKSLSEALFGP